MRLLLDSSVIVSAERRSLTVGQMLLKLLATTNDVELGLSAVALTELVHGIYRAQTPERRLQREAFISELLRDVPIFPYTQEAAMIAGRISGEQQNAGIHIPYADLLIGATALSVGFAVCTENLRHFRLIPGLKLMSV